jgi:PAS domain S-box-containing protein
VTPVDQQTAPEQLEALQQAFDFFTKQTAQLEQAYNELKAETERINLQLEATNRQLQAKVRELDETTNLQQSILAGIPSAVVVVDLDGIIGTFNPAAEALWETACEDAIGRHFSDVLGDHSDLLAGVLRGRRASDDSRREGVGAEARIITSTAALVHDSSGRPIGAVQVDRDITRVCNLETRLNHHEKLADLGKMAAGLVHEIRKPLNGIKGFASLLERRVETDDAEHRYLGNIMHATDRLNGMLGRLLDFARPDGLHPSPCDLEGEMEVVADFLRAEEAAASADILVEVPREASHAMADADKVKQVLLNLGKNALEALEGPGSVTLRSRRCGEDGRTVRVEVADTGTGIAHEDIPRLTEPFFSAKQGGTGLGLSIVNRILQLHGTELSIESSPGQGTVMAFNLPACLDREES